MLQIQRGTGMTKNGSASYVGSMNFESYKPSTSSVGAFFGAGSFGSTKISMNTEQNWKKGGLYASFSDLETKGYKYHSGNHSRSAFLVGNYTTGRNQFKFVGFAGEQMNQLAWLGVPIDSINLDRRYNTCTTRENDHFNQYHLQFHHTYIIDNKSRFNYCVYYNYLNGFYTYDGIHNGTWDTISSGKYNLYAYHLYSNFLGTNVNYYIKLGPLDFYTGVNGSKYDREHHGTTNDIYTYKNTGFRDDLSGFVKGILNAGSFNFYGDVQYRYTTFVYNGDVYLQHFIWNFLNYSVGVEYKAKHNILYYSIGKTHREPIRNDMFGGYDNLSSDPLGKAVFYDLKPESVLDQEFGYRYIIGNLNLNINLYYMLFKDELVLTGAYGPTGLPLHENVDNSFRSGFEFDFKYRWKFGLTLLQNVSYNYSKITWTNKQTTPVLTPEWLSNTEVNYNYKWFIIGLSGRYQSWSYIDQRNNFTIPSFYTLNAMIGLKWSWGEWDIYLNNITDQKTLSSGMVSGDGTPYNQFIPLYYVNAPFNFFTGLKFKM
jgi:iron complex outermembrane receptor protein